MFHEIITVHGEEDRGFFKVSESDLESIVSRLLDFEVILEEVDDLSVDEGLLINDCLDPFDSRLTLEISEVLCFIRLEVGNLFLGVLSDLLQTILVVETDALSELSE